MSTRTIKLKLLTQTSLVAVETSVRTLAEFKELPEVIKMDLKWNQIKLIDRATKNSIDLDSALLPAIDCIIFVTPTKTDSGMANRSELYAIIKEMKAGGVEVPFNMTQVRTSVLEEFIEDNEVELAKSYQQQDEVSPTPTFYQIIDAENGLVVLRQVDTFEAEDTCEGCLLEELADFITNDELDEEQQEIVSQLK
jgi:hypothetical protein